MKRGAQSRRASAIGFATLAIAVVVLAPAAAGAAVPGVDEYSLRPPKADGSEATGSGQPGSEPAELPPAVQEQLRGSANGATLAAIATADELGATEPAGTDASAPETALESVDRRSLPAAAASALVEPWSLAILAAVGALIAIAVTRSRRGEAR